MYRCILLATDGSPVAREAVGHGLSLARRLDSAARIVTVTERWWPLEMAVRARGGDADPVERYEALADAAAQEILEEAGEAARRAGIEAPALHVRDKAPAVGIVETARAQGCDLIVMGSHGRRGLEKLMLGSVANEVVVTSAVPVLIVKGASG